VVGVSVEEEEGEERKLVAQEIPPHLTTSQRWIDFQTLKWMMYRLLAQV
jgi:hypothetical protein